MRWTRKPSLQLVYYWLWWDMHKSKGHHIGIDVGAGDMDLYPWFQTEKYIPIDTDESRLMRAKRKYPVDVCVGDFRHHAKWLRGGFVVAIQLFTHENIQGEPLGDLHDLIGMVNKGGSLIVNFTTRQIRYMTQIRLMLCTSFNHVTERRYRAYPWALSTVFAPLIALGALVIGTGAYNKTYFLCEGRK